MTDWDLRKTWYHGSPLHLATIRVGSTITQDQELARAFSHKPTLVLITDDKRVKHNGTQPGYLHCLAEEIRPEDVQPHPRSSMEPGWEWLTNRDLRVTLMGQTQVVAEELLTPEEIEEIHRKLMSLHEGE
jgi:hypothetical protein